MDCWPDENLNNVRLKIETKKKPTCGYALQNYYRCIHNTRDWSPYSKDPRRKLKLNPSARVKNTNCPFQMVVKIKQESCWTVDVEWEHNQSVQSLEASHFRDVPPDCVECVYQLFESGHTPSILTGHSSILQRRVGLPREEGWNISGVTKKRF